MFEPRRCMGYSLIGPALWREREREIDRGKAGKRRQTQRGEEEKKMHDWPFICLFACVCEQDAVMCSVTYCPTVLFLTCIQFV